MKFERGQRGREESIWRMGVRDDRKILMMYQKDFGGSAIGRMQAMCTSV